MPRTEPSSHAPAVTPAGRHIALFVYSLHGGGGRSESPPIWPPVLPKRAKQVTLITELPPETDQYPLPANIRRITIGTPGNENRIGKWTRMARKVRRLRVAIKAERPDMLVSFMTRGNNMALLAAMGLGVPVVICERNDPRHCLDPPIDRRLRDRLYRRAHLLIEQTPTIEALIRVRFGVGQPFRHRSKDVKVLSKEF